MKLILFIVTLFVTNIAAAQNSEVIRLSEPVQKTADYEVFGAEVEDWPEAATLESLISAGDKYKNKEITLVAEVAKVCQKKGCFFVANDGNYSARITFKEYSFFIPTDSQGKVVKLNGIFNVKELSEEQAKHYAEDAGENPEKVKGSQKEYSVVATSVLVPRN